MSNTELKECFGTLKPVTGSCIGCTQYKDCLNKKYYGDTKRGF